MKNFTEAVVVYLGLIVVVFFFYSNLETTIINTEHAVAATSSAVTVSATVVATISCSTSQGSTAFGTLTDVTVGTASPNTSTTTSCVNSASGCSLFVKDVGGGGNPGLYNTTSTSLIESPNASFSATSTLIAGTEGYGVQATSTSVGTGAAFSIANRYLQTGNTVGGLSTTNLTLASSNATSSNREVIVTYKAAVAAATAAGSYSDTTTYECTAN